MLYAIRGQEQTTYEKRRNKLIYTTAVQRANILDVSVELLLAAT